MLRKLSMLLIFLLFLASCNGEEAGNEASLPANGAAVQNEARYVEYNISPPDMKGVPVFYYHGKNGEIELVSAVGYDAKSRTEPVSWYSYSSADKGKSWQEKDISWTDAYKYSWLEYAQDKEKKELHRNISRLIPLSGGRFLAQMENFGQESHHIYSSLCLFESDGSTSELSVPIIDDFQNKDEFINIRSIDVLSDKRAYIRYDRSFSDEEKGSLFLSAIISLEDGSCVYNGECESFYGYTHDDNYVLEFANEFSLQISIADGTAEKNSDYPFIWQIGQLMGGVITEDALALDNKKIHNLGAGKISVVDLDTKKCETLAEGNYYSFSAGVNKISNVRRLGGGEYLALCDNQIGGGKLLHYVYKENPPFLGAESLIVFSINEHESIKLAIYEIGLIYPGIKVNYEFIYGADGLKADYTLLPEDRISRLNIELLAGGGPDVIILDGLPWESYIEKGVLEDLSPFVDRNSLFSSVYNSFYDSSGSLYMAPVRVAVPVMLYPGAQTQAMQGYESIKKELPSYSKEKPFAAFTDFDEMLEYFTALYLPSVVKEGAIDAAALSEYFETLKLLDSVCAYNAEAERWSKYNGSYYEGDNLMSAKAFSQSLLRFSLGEAKTGHDTVLGFSDYFFTERMSFFHEAKAVKVFENEEYQGMSTPAPLKGVYYPKIAAAINSGGANKKQAEAFVGLLLGTTVQSYEMREGLPVNKSAFNASLDTIAKKNRSNKESLGINFEDIMNSLQTPSMANAHIYDALLESGKKLRDGQLSLDEAAEYVIERTAMYLNERADVPE